MNTLKINPGALRTELQRLLQPHAFAGGAYLLDAITQPGRGTHWPENPYPSSAPGDYPTFQTGALTESLDVRPDGAEGFKIGFFEDANAEGFRHASELRSRPPERGGRYPLEKFTGDPLAHQAILKGQ